MLVLIALVGLLFIVENFKDEPKKIVVPPSGPPPKPGEVPDFFKTQFVPTGPTSGTIEMPADMVNRLNQSAAEDANNAIRTLQRYIEFQQQMPMPSQPPSPGLKQGAMMQASIQARPPPVSQKNQSNQFNRFKTM